MAAPRWGFCFYIYIYRYYFLIFLYYFFPTVTFFQTLAWFIFLGFPTIFFFLSLPQPLAPVQHIATHAVPWYTDQPIQTHHHTHRATHTQTQTQTIKPSTEPHTHKPSNQLEPTTATTPTNQAINQQSQATDQKPKPSIWNPARLKYPKKGRWSTQKKSKIPKPPINKPKPPIRNSRRRFETQVVENTQKKADDQPRKRRKYLKIPKPLIRNPHHRFETQAVENTQQNQNQTKTKATPVEQTHYKKIIIKATNRVTDDQPNRSTHWSTDPPFQMHRSTDPNPPSINPSPPIQTQLVDPR